MSYPLKPALILSPLPFPVWEFNCICQVYAQTETETDGRTAELVYSGPAVKKSSSDTSYDQNGAEIATTGLIIIQGSVQTQEDNAPFTGYAVIDGIKRPIKRMTKPTALGQVYSTELELL